MGKTEEYREKIRQPPTNLPKMDQDDLNKLNDDELWRVADSQYDASKQLLYRALLRKNARGLLSEDERAQMNIHLESVDRLTFQKSYAYTLLKSRGHLLPTLSELEKRQ